MAGFRERLTGFQKAFQARQDQRPAAGDRLEELRVGLVDLVGDGEFDRIGLFLDFIGQMRVKPSARSSGRNSLRHDKTSRRGGLISRISPLSAIGRRGS